MTTDRSTDTSKSAETRYALLQVERIDWTRFEALGGDILATAEEARRYGDEALYRRAIRAAERRGLVS